MNWLRILLSSKARHTMMLWARWCEDYVSEVCPCYMPVHCLSSLQRLWSMHAPSLHSTLEKPSLQLLRTWTHTPTVDHWECVQEWAPSISQPQHLSLWGVLLPITTLAISTPLFFQMFPLATVVGNTFVMKPSEQCPGALMLLAQMAQDAGLPDGVLNVIHGQKTGKAITAKNWSSFWHTMWLSQLHHILLKK